MRPHPVGLVVVHLLPLNLKVARLPQLRAAHGGSDDVWCRQGREKWPHQ